MGSVEVPRRSEQRDRFKYNIKRDWGFGKKKKPKKKTQKVRGKRT